ncbi:MAG: DNA polymerase III subunit beta [Deltaproteobacteria bacterium]|nr:DNA polymerase III subunit beta [Deltaproteobacteria bacterium]
MKFKIEKTAFIKTLQRIQGIVEKRNTMPVLSNVLMETTGNRLNTIATDLEVFIKDSIAADVEEQGAITVNARKLFEIVKELPSDKADISSTKDGNLTVKGGKARFNIMGIPSKDFPVFPKAEDARLEGIEKETLKEMIDKTAFAVSMDETRYNINGFLLEKDDSIIRMVTTDGHRLALIEKKGVIGMAGDGKNSVLLPRKGLMEIRKLLEEENKEGFFLGISQKSAAMKRGDTVINIRLLEGEFPDYKKVIPKGNDQNAITDRFSLLSSLKRVSILSSDKIRGVKFNFSNKKLTLSSSSPDIGDATEELDIEYSGTDIEIAFNARYLIDMLEAVEEDKVKIALKDSLSPGIVTPEGGRDYTYIIMPMRL